MNLRLWAALALLSATLFACASGDESKPKKNATTASASCVPDPALIEAAHACLADDDCPCGAHCHLGVCEASCAADTDCGDGQRCDDFGRCRFAAATALAPAPPVVAEAKVRAVEPLTRVSPADGVGLLRFNVDDADADQLRVRAKGGTEVHCPDGDWSVECRIEGVHAGSRLELPVRLVGAQAADDGGAEDEAEGEVQVFAGQSMTTVSVKRPALPMEAAPEPRLEGSWTGTAVSRASGFGTAADPGMELEVPLTLPAEARIWGDLADATIELVDRYGGFAGEAGAMVGTVALADEDGDGTWEGEARFPARRLLAGELVSGEAGYEVIADAIRATLRLRSSPELLVVELVDVLEGVAPTAQQPTIGWRLALRRTGEVEGSAPAPTDDAAPSTEAAAVAETPTSWEAAFASTLPRWSDLQTHEARFEALDFLEGKTSVDACYLGSLDEEAGLTALGLWPGFSATFDLPEDGAPDPESIYGRTEPLAKGFTNFAYDIAGELTRLSITSLELRPGDPVGPIAGGTLPCRGRFTLGYVAGLGNFADSRRGAFPFDVCETYAARTGCRIEPARADDGSNSRVYLVDWNYDYELIDGATGSGNKDGRVHLDWSQVCVMPSAPAHCAEAVACLDPVDEETPASVASSGFAPSLGTASGEALCEATGRSAAIALDARADDPGAPAPTARELFERCTADFDRLRAGATSPAGAYGAGLGTLLEASECFDPARLLVAIRLGLEAARGEAPGSAAAEEAGAYAIRLLGRWLELHAFIASEALEREKMAAVFRGTGDFESPEVEEALEISTGAWDLLLHPRFADALAQVAPEVLAQPDYRGFELGLGGRLGDPQKTGLPAVMLDTLARQAELLHLVLEKGSMRADETVLDQVRAVIPRFMAVRALAAGLTERAAFHDPGFPWWDRYVGAERRFSTKIGGALSLAAAIEEGLNPLGIEDEDLPLYFLADAAEGPGGRFAAISDFLLGNGPGSNAWAPALVGQAAEALNAARTSYLDQVDRNYLIARDERDHRRWVGEVRDEYNAELRDYCGPIAESLVDDPFFRPESCAINWGDAACRTDENLWFDSWTEADLVGRICVHDALAEVGGRGVTGFRSEAAIDFVEACFADGLPDGLAIEEADHLRVEACPDAPDQRCLVCVQGEAAPLPLSSAALEIAAPAPESRGMQEAREEETIEPAKLSFFNWALDDCRDRYPTMRLHPPQPSSIFEVPGCVRGTLGEAYLDVATASRDVEAARASYGEHLEAYDIAVRSCQLLEAGAAELKRLRDEHEANMVGLITAKQVVDTAAASAAAAKECAQTITGADTTTPWGAISGSVSAGAACAAGGVEAGLNIASINLEAEMENVQRRHDAAVAEVEEQTEIRICYNDARQELVGLTAASLAIEQAIFDLQRAQATVTQELADAQRIWEDGHEYLAQIESYPVRPPAGDLWVNERVNTYVRRFELARRATYLAVRAVEYETQQSQGARDAVLEAETPDELEAVLQELWTSAGTRTVNGNRPSDLHVVLSLRDDILRVGDESLWPSAMQPLTPTERFRLLLSSPRYAIYDEAGRYLGQQIPFDLVPLGAMGEETRGVPIYGTNDCAERVWSVNASVLGEDVMEGTDTSFLRVDLLKRNTFFSQWCGEPEEGARFQAASVRPTRNLFRAPGIGSQVGNDFGTGADTSGWTRARMSAFVNVDRHGLEDPGYASGETSELAARGLFGEYQLFIPAELVARETPSGGYSTGLVLDRVDDILLRLDYVSVAR